MAKKLNHTRLCHNNMLIHRSGSNGKNINNWEKNNLLLSNPKSELLSTELNPLFLHKSKGDRS